MKTFTFLLKAALVFCCLTGKLCAQEAIVSSGGVISSGNGLVSFSVGQTFFNTWVNSENTITEGIQQPSEFYAITGVGELPMSELPVRVYPNPVSDYLFLEVEDDGQSMVYFQLFDMNGKMLQNGKLEGNANRINMLGYKPSIYLLKIRMNNNKFKTIKIVKN